MFLTGSKATKLDSKGRLVLQASFRKEFPNGVVKLVPVKGALYGFTAEDYVAWIDENYPERDNLKSSDSETAAVLNAHAVEVELDKAGRLAVGRADSQVLARLGISSEVVVSGNGSHFEIWNKAKWDAEKSLDVLTPELDSLMFG